MYCITELYFFLQFFNIFLKLGKKRQLAEKDCTFSRKTCKNILCKKTVPQLPGNNLLFFLLDKGIEKKRNTVKRKLLHENHSE